MASFGYSHIKKDKIVAEHLDVQINKTRIIYNNVSYNNTNVLTVWWWIVYVALMADEKRLAWFPAGTIVRDPHNRESWESWHS